MGKVVNSVLLFAGLLFCSKVFASSAGFSNEVPDARGTGSCSAVMARPENPSANWYNPAGIARLEGIQTSISGIFEYTSFEFESDSGRTVEAENGLHFIPSVFYSQQLNDQWTLGAGFSSAYGLNSEWEDPLLSYVATYSELKTFTFNPNVSYAFNERLSIAVGIDFTYASGQLEKNINQTFLNSYLYYQMFGNNVLLMTPDAESSLEGDDYATSGNFAVLYSPLENLHLGFSYRSKVDLDLEGEVTLKNLAGLSETVFGGTRYEVDGSVEIPIPATYTFGIAYDFNSTTSVELDIELAEWSAYDQLEIRYKETNPVRASILNNDNPQEKDWDDTWNFSLAAQHKWNDNLSFFGATQYRKSPVPEETFEPAVMGNTLFNLAGGFSFLLNNVSRLDFCINQVWALERDINNDVGETVGISIDGKYKGSTSVIGMTYNIKF